MVELLKTSEKAFIFLYSKYIILRIIGERERDFYSNTRNFNNNNNNNINIRNRLKVAKFFG